MVFDALKTQKKVPKRIAFVTNTGGSTNFISYGPPNSSEGGAVEAAKKAGFNVVADIQYPPTVSDWGSIAAQVRAAKPDFVWNNGLAVDPTNLIQAMKQLDYWPPQIFTLFPAPGPLLALRRRPTTCCRCRCSSRTATLLKQLGKDARRSSPSSAGSEGGEGLVPRVRLAGDRVVERWEVLAAGVQGAKSTDNEGVQTTSRPTESKTTFIGTLKFNPATNNFPTAANLSVKQIQNRRWKIVWPTSRSGRRSWSPQAATLGRPRL